eukprot:8793363-Karenia_brevis.AAC.1
MGVARSRLPDWSLCSAGSMQRQQRALTKHVATSARAAILASMAEPEAAHLRSCGGVGAGAF